MTIQFQNGCIIYTLRGDVSRALYCNYLFYYYLCSYTFVLLDLYLLCSCQIHLIVPLSGICNSTTVVTSFLLRIQMWFSNALQLAKPVQVRLKSEEACTKGYCCAPLFWKRLVLQLIHIVCTILDMNFELKQI